MTQQFKVARCDEAALDLTRHSTTLGIDEGCVLTTLNTQLLYINLTHLYLGLNREATTLYE